MQGYLKDSSRLKPRKVENKFKKLDMQIREC